MTPPSATHQRFHDLDALRAAAMLIGIIYHVSLSFALGFPWMVQDVVQAKWPFIFQAWVHGFRMQLFMLVSGFFTAMLWRRKGLKALLRQRSIRVLVPCLLGLITVVPAMNWSVNFAFRHSGAHRSATAEPASSSLWAAIRQGDNPALVNHIDGGASVTDLHPAYAVTPLQWAALLGRRETAALLLERGSPVDGRSRDGHTALHSAAFMGYPEVVALLLERGADVNAQSVSGEVPWQSASQEFGVVRYIAGLLNLPVDEARWVTGRKAVLSHLEAAGAKTTSTAASGGALPRSAREIWNGLVHTPVFVLVWFLWFLVWLVALFSLYAVIVDKLGRPGRRPVWLLSRWNLVWLVPLTAIPTAMMDYDLGLGPDTSMGLIPMPHVLVYYAIFFFFGVLYFDCDDREHRLGGDWRWMLPSTLLIIFPVAMEFTTGIFQFRDALLPARFHRAASVVLQSLFAWGMCSGSIGLFRALLTRENRFIRYLSDSSYWLYLAHLPLCIAGQAIISQWRGPVWLKLSLFSLSLTAFLLLTYHFLVRYTWVGRLLNGPRIKPMKSLPSTAAP
ncbi:MAG: acyltransferase family protein [Verrucomicrobiales bacterium]